MEGDRRDVVGILETLLLLPAPWTTIQNHPARRIGDCKEQKEVPRGHTQYPVCGGDPLDQPPAACGLIGMRRYKWKRPDS